jgi:hypothetical protein
MLLENGALKKTKGINARSIVDATIATPILVVHAYAPNDCSCGSCAVFEWRSGAGFDVCREAKAKRYCDNQLCVFPKKKK